MKKIVILSSLGIGDVITLGPLLKKLKKIYPESKIIVYSSKGGCLKDQNIFYVDRVRELKNLTGLNNFLKEKPDLLINLGYYSNICGKLGVLFYYFFTYFPKANKKIYYGELESQELKYKNMVQIKLDILKKLNIKINEKDYNLFMPFSFDKEKEKIREPLKKEGIKKKDPFVVLHIGAKKDYISRFWPQERWIKILKKIKTNYGSKICFIGGRDDLEETEKIINNLDFSVLNLVDKLSLEETCALIKNCDLFISTNSGPMWIAAALRKPQIALCGPSKFSWDPYNERAIVARGFSSGKGCPCDTKKCKYCASSMRSIQVEEVQKNIKRIMENE